MNKVTIIVITDNLSKIFGKLSFAFLQQNIFLPLINTCLVPLKI